MANEKQELDLKGMHCAACSTRIEKVVGTVNGVFLATVNLATEKISLEFDPQQVSLSALKEKLRPLGFELVIPDEKKVIDLKITGMHCAACSARIEKVLTNQEGIESCSVNLATEQAQVRFHPLIVSQSRIKELITGLGFSATSKPQTSDSQKDVEESKARLEAIRRKLFPSFVLAVLIMVISMGHMVGIHMPGFLDPSLVPVNYALVQFLLLLPILWMGKHFYINGVPALLRGIPNMDSLIAMGTGAAFIYSTWNLVEIVLGIDAIARAHDLYFESAAMLIALVSLGKYLEAKSKVKTTDAIRKLMQLAPEMATLIKNGEQRPIQVVDIMVGDHILIRPGERVPVDGVIIDGSSNVDESMLTGESFPVTKTVSDTVFGGTLNKNGALTIGAEKIGEDTVLARIVRLVREAQGAKAPIANFADRISLYFVPMVMVIAFTAGVSWYFLGDAGFSYSLRIFIAVLVIACPCAMGLATPTSIMVGTGRGAQLGVVVKNGEVLELARKVKCVVFDKTGTLTRGKPTLTDITTLGGYDEELAVILAASSEMRSEHPLAGALLEAADKRKNRKKRKYQLSEPRSFSPVQGMGIEAEIDLEDISYSVCLGNRELIVQQEIFGLGQEVEQQADQWSTEGKTVLYLGVNGALAAIFAIADPLKEEAPQTIAHLKKMGLDVVMLTGDNEVTAQTIAAQAGISKVVAGVLPDRKEHEISKLQVDGTLVAMVGDGINDAPALARADVGIAMGTGIDVAIESADIILIKGDLSGVCTAISLSRATMRNIKQNLFWAFAYNVFGIPVAAGVLAIFGGPTLNPMIGGAAMAFSSVSVVTNALRLRFLVPTNNQ